MKPYRLVVCAIFKNEARYLREWLRWHLVLGVDHFQLYDHQSTDGRDVIFADPEFHSKVTVLPVRGRVPQVAAYNHAVGALSGLAEWMAILDIDEFLVPLSSKKPTIPGVLEDFKAAPGVCVNWALFGSSGRTEYPREGILRGFLRKAPACDEVNRHVKAIARPDQVLRCEHVHGFRYTDGRMPLDMAHRPVEWPGTHCDICYDGLRINHYCVRSKGEFEEKMARGRADDPNPQHRRDWRFFEAHDRNEEEDRLAADMAIRLKVYPGEIPLVCT